MNKMDYIRSGGTCCPYCSSKNLQAGEPPRRHVSCGECEKMWIEVTALQDITTPDGSPIPGPALLPLKELFSWRWIMTLRRGKDDRMGILCSMPDVQIQGPYKGGRWMHAARAIFLASGNVGNRDILQMWSISLNDQTGQLEDVEIPLRENGPYGFCDECGELFDDSNTSVCKTCQDLVVKKE